MRDNVVENAVLGACVELEDGKYALTLSREEAERIGIPVEWYDGMAADVAAVNAQIASGTVDVATLAKRESSATSVFFNHAILGMAKVPGLMTAYKRELAALKVRP